MSLNDTMTNLADSLRKQYGGGQKLSLDMINEGIIGLNEPTSLIANGQSWDNTTPTDTPIKFADSVNFDKDIVDHSIILSFDAKWTNFTGGRFGFEMNSSKDYQGCWIKFGNPGSTNNTTHYFDVNTVTDYVHVSSLYHIRSDYTFSNFKFYNQATADSFEIINPKFVINPWGGGDYTNAF